jgi:PAS domain S-box-containing protein
MVIMPRLISPQAAMTAMRDLHLNWSWISTLIGILSIVGGLLYLLTTLFPRIAANIATLQSETAERLRIGTALAESEVLFQTVIDNAPVFIALKDTEGRNLVLGPNCEQFYGVRREDTFGKAPHDLFVPEIADRLAAHDRTILETGRTVEQEYEIPLADGVHAIHSIKFPVPDGDGGIAGIGIISSDVTERKRIEADLKQAHEELEARVAERTEELQRSREALQRSEEAKHAVLAASDDSIFLVERDGTVLEVNEGAARRYGKSREEILGTSIFDPLPPDLARSRRAYLARLDAGEPAHFEDQRNGIWFENFAYPVSFADGKVEKFAVFARDITARKRAEDALRESEASLANAQRIAHLGNWDWNIETNELHWSDEIYRIFGLAPQEFGATYDAFMSSVHPEDRDKVQQAVDSSIRDMTPYRCEHRVIRRDGSERVVFEQGEVTYDAKNRPLHMVGTVLDITGRRAAEKALKQSEALLGAVVENSPLPILLKDVEGRYVVINKRAAKIFGFSQEQALGKTVHDFFPKDLADCYRAHERSVIETRSAIEKEFMIPTTEGDRSFLEVKFPVPDASGAPRGLGAIISDVTEQKEAEAEVLRLNEELEQRVEKRTAELVEANATLQSEIAERQRAEEALDENRRQLQLVIDAQPLLIGYVDKDQRWRLNNVEYENWTGLPRDELAGRHIRDGLGETAYKRIRPFVERALAGERLSFDTTVSYDHGGTRHVKANYIPDVGENGQVEGFFSTVMDVSELKQAEQKVRESESRFRAFVEHSPNLIYLKDDQGRYVFFNKEFEDAVGLTREDAYGKTAIECFADDRAETYTRHDQEVLDHRKAVIQEKLVAHRDGTEREQIVTKFPIFDDDGDVVGIGGINTDISYRKRLELELLRKERLATLGQLTATVSHELRNPLGTMRTSMYVLDKAIDKADERAARAAERVTRSIVRCDRIIDDLLDFTRAQVSDRQSIVVDEWLAELLDELPVPDGIELDRGLAGPGVSVDIDPERLRRAIINLYDNACQAASDAHPGTTPGPRVAVSTQLRGESFEIAVSDSGPGIAPDDLGKIFEPLFSTKNFGTGLGLPTVKQIIEQHGGAIEVETEEGHGAHFRLLLPLRRMDEAAA